MTKVGPCLLTDAYLMLDWLLGWVRLLFDFTSIAKVFLRKRNADHQYHELVSREHQTYTWEWTAHFSLWMTYGVPDQHSHLVGPKSSPSQYTTHAL